MSLFTVLFSLLFNSYSCTHILISGMTSSYGIWNQLLHISKELISRESDFVTFIIEESRDYYLDKIRDDNTLNPSFYQIINTPKEFQLNATKILHANAFEKMHIGMDLVIKASYTAMETLVSFLAQCQSDATNQSMHELNITFNKNMNKYNNIATIKFDKIDVCLFGPIHLFGIHVCDVFDIPTVIRHETATLSTLEYYGFYHSFLYFNDLFVFDMYPDNVINGSVMTYSQRMFNLIPKMMYIILQKLGSEYKLKPALRKLNNEYLSVVNKAVDIDYKYNDFFHSIWDKAVIISSLGPPYSTVFYSRPRIKQFGFLIHETQLSENTEIFNWIDENDKPILYVSMGSVMKLPQNALKYIYEILVVDSKQNDYRILWALRQNIYDNLTIDELQKPYLKIMKWMPQIEVLQSSKVKIFLTHSGGNGVLEGLYTKTPMILFPRAGDQFFNAIRIKEVGCGLMIKDRDTLSDLTKHIYTLLLNKTSALYYYNNLNILHEMLTQNGGVSEAADFLEYIGKYGNSHLFCTLGHLHNCKHRSIPWYQKTLIDVYLGIFSVLVLIIVFVNKCCCKKSAIQKHKVE
eukprot:394329_1